MVNDRKIALPRSLGWFTISGEPEEGKLVWYSISFRDINYTIHRGDSLTICSAVTIRKKRQVFGKSPSWWLQFFFTETVWEFTSSRFAELTGDYRCSLTSEALNGGVVLDRRFFAELCAVPESRLAGLKQEIADAFSPQLHVVKAAA